MARVYQTDPRTAIVNAARACETWLRQIPAMRKRGNPLAAEFARLQAENWSRLAFTRARDL